MGGFSPELWIRFGTEKPDLNAPPSLHAEQLLGVAAPVLDIVSKSFPNTTLRWRGNSRSRSRCIATESPRPRSLSGISANSPHSRVWFAQSRTRRARCCAIGSSAVPQGSAGNSGQDQKIVERSQRGDPRIGGFLFRACSRFATGAGRPERNRLPLPRHCGVRHRGLKKHPKLPDLWATVQSFELPPWALVLATGRLLPHAMVMDSGVAAPWARKLFDKQLRLAHKCREDEPA